MEEFAVPPLLAADHRHLSRFAKIAWGSDLDGTSHSQHSSAEDDEMTRFEEGFCGSSC